MRSQVYSNWRARHAFIYQSQVACEPSDTLSYRPLPNDTLALSPTAEWNWQEDATGVSLVGTRTLRITVNPANYTPEMLASAARCPAGDSDEFTIGWDISFDVQTGEILFVTPGLDCVVC